MILFISKSEENAQSTSLHSLGKMSDWMRREFVTQPDIMNIGSVISKSEDVSKNFYDTWKDVKRNDL